MASFLHLRSIILSLLLTALFFSQAFSQTCSSQTFTSNNARYTNCTDLPSLRSFLHWSYNPTNTTFSVAFVATPPNSNGWIAWAINPTGTGMAGAQALLAYRASNGSMVVKTYKISNYSSIVESNLSFNVLDKRAEFSNGTMRILATLALPENMTAFNYIWQVGPSMNNGRPVKHEFAPENLNAKGNLELVKAGNNNGTAAAAAAPGPSESGTNRNTTGGSGGEQSRNDNSGGGCGRLLSSGIYSFFLLLLGIFVLGF